MMPRFILAKYVPQLNRMEPRNIGVILWAKGEIASKFLPVESADFIADVDGYQWWINSWLKAVASSEVRPLRGKPVSKKSPESMDAILSLQEGQFLLVDAGELLEDIRKSQIQEAVQFLFQDLVAFKSSSTDVEKAGSALQQGIKSIFETSGIVNRGDYHTGYKVECAVYGSKREIKFSHALGNGKPNAIFQEAALKREQSVYSTALKVHTVIEAAIIRKERCGIIVNGEDIDSDASQDNYELLLNVAPVIDISKKDAVDQLLKIASKRLPVRQPKPH
mgnify:CR=1 FL=1